MTFQSPLKIEVASSDADLEAVYRLRYGQVGSSKFNLEPPESLKYRDILDTPAATILVVRAGNQIVGTLRMTPRSAGAFIRDDDYDWSQLTSKLEVKIDDIMNHASLFDRGVVNADFQGHGLLGVLYKRAARIAQTQGNKYVVCAASHENVSLRISSRRGFKEYAQAESGGHKMAILFARVEDVIRSN